MNRISYWIFRGFSFVIGIIPFTWLYLFSDTVAYILHHIIGYRKKVISTNLQNSFPHLSQNDKAKLTKEVYLSLSDMILEGIKSYMLSFESLHNNRYKFTNKPYINDLMKKHDGLLILSSHYNNWEWAVSIINKTMSQNCIGFYKTLSHPLINQYMYDKRTKNGTKAFPSNQSLRVIYKEKENNPMVFLIADQSPSNLNKVEWVDFLNQKTAFLIGPEKIAMKYNFPVLYLAVKKVKRGYYEATYEMLVNDPNACNPGEITHIYAKHLEQKIIENPSPWLWSHRRWKHKQS